MRALLLLALCFPLLAQCQKAQTAPAGFQALRNLDYVGSGNQRQMLDLYLPIAKSDTPNALIVYIHGGGWSAGSKDQAEVLVGLIKGSTPYAGASLNYRLTNQAQWPAQIHDCKAAIRWLRGHAKEYNIDPDKIAVFGISAGGHLVSMLGVTGGVKELEGDLGKHLDQSSRVTCVLDFCGPSNFLTFGGKGSVLDPDDPKGPLAKLIGGPLKDRNEIGRNASPVTYLSQDDAASAHERKITAGRRAFSHHPWGQGHHRPLLPGHGVRYGVESGAHPQHTAYRHEWRSCFPERPARGTHE